MDLEALKYVSDLGVTGLVVVVIVWAVKAISLQLRAQADQNEKHIAAARDAERLHMTQFVDGVQTYLTETRGVERQHVEAVLAANERISTQTTEQARHLAEIGRQNVELARELRGLADDMRAMKREG